MKNTVKVLKTAFPLYLEGSNGKAVFVQHGYNGYPGEMYELARRLNSEGYTVVVPRLPGHGTNGKDFIATNWKLWLSHVRNEYILLQSRFDEVYVVGLSMGGTLALILAEEFSPVKTILLAPAMAVDNPVFYFTPLLKIFLPELKRNRSYDDETDPDRIILAREYWTHYFIARIADVNKLMRKARKGLREIDCPVYIMVSEKDKTVPQKTGDIIAAGLKKPPVKLVLKNSPHVFFEGPENEFVLNKIMEWMNDE